MRKLIYIWMLLLSGYNFCYSQNGEVITKPATTTAFHFIKIDVLKSLTSRLHFDYERYNGKTRGLELGITMFYPNYICSYIDEGIAFHYKGWGGEVKEKFYFNREFWKFYLGPQLSFESKSFDQTDIWIVNGFRSSSYSYSETISAKESAVKVCVIAGFMSKFEKGFVIDMNIGPGIGYIDSYVTRDDTGNHPDSYRIPLGHHKSWGPQLDLSFKFAFGIKGKTK